MGNVLKKSPPGFFRALKTLHGTSSIISPHVSSHFISWGFSRGNGLLVTLSLLVVPSLVVALWSFIQTEKRWNGAVGSGPGMEPSPIGNGPTEFDLMFFGEDQILGNPRVDLIREDVGDGSRGSCGIRDTRCLASVGMREARPDVVFEGGVFETVPRGDG